MEYEGKGVLTSVSNHSCDVSVCIDGTTRSLSFSRRVFYSFGVRCEGSMTNILEEGMEVDLCYKISHPDDPCTVAVWLGEKPDSFNDMKLDSDDEYSDVSDDDSSGEHPWGAIYDKVGHVIAVDTDTFLVQSDKYKVAISRDVVFRDDCRLDQNATLDIDEEITFDAIPCESEDPSGASHQATCAWIGQQPRLVDRFNLDSMNELDKDCKELVLERHEIYGTVVVIPSEVVALVEVKFESTLYEVMLFRNSFERAGERIQDMVDVGDTLCMRLSYGYIFPGCRQWIAAKAVLGDECSWSSVESAVEANVESSEESECFTGNVVAGNENMADVKYVVLYGDPPLTGTLSQSSCDRACINYKGFKIFVTRDNFYIDGQKGKNCDFMLFVSRGNDKVNFEAVPTKLKDFTHEATCVWVGDRPDVGVVASYLPQPKLALLKEKGQIFYGIVTKLCLPRIALAVIPRKLTTVTISVPFFVSDPLYESESGETLISDYVRLNDFVQFRVMSFIPEVLTGWDVHVIPFSEEAQEKMRVFVSREPCEIPEVGKSSTKNPTGQPVASRNTAAVGSKVSNVKKAGAKKRNARKRTAKKATAKTDTAKNVTVKPAAAKKAPTKKATANNATVKNVPAKIATANNATAKSTTRKAAGVKNASAKTVTAKSVAAKNVAKKNAAAKSVAKKNAATKNATAKAAALKNATAKTAKAQNVTAKTTAAENATKNAAVKNPAAKHTVTKAAAAKNASAKTVTAKNVAKKNAAAKNVTANTAGVKNATSNTTGVKNATAKNVAAKTTTAKNRTKNGAAKNPTAKNTATKTAAAKIAKTVAGKSAVTKNATKMNGTA